VKIRKATNSEFAHECYDLVRKMARDYATFYERLDDFVDETQNGPPHGRSDGTLSAPNWERLRRHSRRARHNSPIATIPLECP
jgi:hypothetical protein